jgi:voltage-gated potassium channel
MNPFKRLIIPGIILLTIISVGIGWYTQVEKWSLLDAGYMLVITLFTIGFEEVHQLSDPGRIFTMLLIISGVSTVLYAVGKLGEMIIEGHVVGYGRRKRMEQKIKNMKDHYIICGFGRVGHRVKEELDAAKLSYIVIDIKPSTAVELEAEGIPYLIGDSTADGRLEDAGVRVAKGLIACADSDTENVFVTLTARAANPRIYIVARASNRYAEEKLKMAGANRIISPYYMAGNRMAALALRPVASDYLDLVMHGDGLEFSLREYALPDNSALLAKTLAEAAIRQKSGATVLAIKKQSGNFDLQPVANSKIEKGDILVVIGTQEQHDKFEKMLKA